jgi:hypothetical protein
LRATGILLSDQWFERFGNKPRCGASRLQDLSVAGVCRSAWGWRRNGEVAMVKTLIFAAAALAAAMGLNIPAADAATWRENPWCAVIDYGDGGVTWECNYRTFDECYPNVLAGNKGSCNLNPAGPGPQAATPAAPRKKHHAQR